MCQPSYPALALAVTAHLQGEKSRDHLASPLVIFLFVTWSHQTSSEQIPPSVDAASKAPALPPWLRHQRILTAVTENIQLLSKSDDVYKKPRFSLKLETRKKWSVFERRDIMFHTAVELYCQWHRATTKWNKYQKDSHTHIPTWHLVGVVS